MTHCIAYHTRCKGCANNGKLSGNNLGHYSFKTITINGKDRLARHIYENCRVLNSRDGNLVQYHLHIDNKIITQHRYNIIYAAACWTEVTSFEHILKRLRAKKPVSNMIRNGVNPDDRGDGDHSLHRLMMISNSVYFYSPVDHTTN